MKSTLARCSAIVWLLLTCSVSRAADLDFPARPVKVIVPFAAGGGSDTFGRIIQSAIRDNELLPQPMVMVNVPGAGGTIGSRRVKNTRPDGYTILLLHEGILTAKHAGQSAYGPEAFAPIIGTGDSTQVIAVAEDSEFDDLNALMDAVKTRPGELIFSANIGAPSHFAGLMLQAESDGAEFRYTQNGGGAKRLAAILGEHVEVSAFSIAEYVQFRESGLRALALLGSERHPEIPELPTAAEQGFDVISQNMQFWWAPIGTPEERIAVLAKAIGEAMRTPEVQQRLKEMRLQDTTLTGEELQSELQQRDARIAAVATWIPPALPNFPLWVITAAMLLAVIAVIRNRSSETAAKEADQDATTVNWSLLITIGGTTVLYVLAMQLELLSFVPATGLFVLACGGSLVTRQGKNRKRVMAKPIMAIVATAFAMSFALHFVFTQVLVVDLP